jgi:hypothetical protein
LYIPADNREVFKNTLEKDLPNLTPVSPPDSNTLGGYGDPWEMDLELIRKDVREGKVSPQKTKLDYGVGIMNSGPT